MTKDEIGRLRGAYLVARDSARIAEKAYYEALRKAVKARRRLMAATIEAACEMERTDEL